MDGLVYDHEVNGPNTRLTRLPVMTTSGARVNKTRNLYQQHLNWSITLFDGESVYSLALPSIFPRKCCVLMSYPLVNATKIKIFEAPVHANHDQTSDQGSSVPWQFCPLTWSQFHENWKGWFGGY